MITVRKATETDSEAIISFQMAMAMETENLSLDRNTLTQGVIAVFSDETHGRYYVAEDNGIVVASLMITYEWSDWRNGVIWWFQSVYVIPDYRRKGVFRLMYDYIREIGLNEGICGLRLYVESENHRAQKTYEAMGMNGSHYKTYEWLRE